MTAVSHLVLPALCLVVGVLLWPDRWSRSARLDEECTDGVPCGEGPGRPSAAGSATVEDLADALVLVAMGLRGGRDRQSALLSAADLSVAQIGEDLRTLAAAESWGLDPRDAFSMLDEAWEPVGVALEAARRAGIAPSGLLLSIGERIRRQETELVAARLQRVTVLLVLPLGLLFLPGFLATTVVPVAVALLSAPGL